MLKLKKLRFKGIGRFIQQQEICFDNFGNLIQIDGINNNTGGSSGAAKSTVLNAIAFLFGISDIPNSMLQSRLTDETILVEGELDLDNEPFLISRGKKLKIVLNGETITGSSKITEEKLDSILAIPRHLFALMLHKKQDEKGFFLNFTPQEMNDFLTDCLELGKFKKKIDDLDTKDLLKKIDEATKILESHLTSIKATQEASKALGLPPVKEIDQEGVLKLKNQMEAINVDLQALLDNQKIEESEFTKTNVLKTEYVPFNTGLLDEYENTLKNYHQEVNVLKLQLKDKESEINKAINQVKLKQSELNSVIQKGILAKEEASKLANEILKVRKNSCPRCEQTWTNDAAKLDEAKMLAKIEKLKEIISLGSIASSSLESLQKELDTLSYIPDSGILSSIDAITKLSEDLKAKIEEEKQKKLSYEKEQHILNESKGWNITSKYKELKQKQAQESQQLRGQADLLRRSFEAAAMSLKNHNDMAMKYKETASKLQAQETLYVHKAAAATSELTLLQSQFDLKEELKRAIKSYLSCCFDEILEIISENATKMIQNIPNMQNATIQLESLKETKEGKVKEEVNAVLHVDGEENVPIKTLSGGERASVDLAVDLSVLNLIEERANKGINIFLLDEPFRGLESVNIEMVLEVLKNSNSHKKLIVIDHNPVVKEQISDRIMVIRDGLISKIA